MNLILIGPQGSGKGTQAGRLAKRFGLCHLSSGDILRSVEGELKEEVNEFMKRGELVPNELVFKVLKKSMESSKCKKGFILDGFPRNKAQAEELKKIVNIDKCIEIVISDVEAMKRISGRRTCAKCGAVYNVDSLRPKVEGVCDLCGGRLVIRDDDNESALKRRLQLYHRETEKILPMFNFVKIDGEQDASEVFRNILKVLE